MQAYVKAVNIGLPVSYDTGGVRWKSAIAKQPVNGERMLGPEGLEGDGQADLKHHGGPDKAICVYPFEHYPYWEERLGRVLPVAAFGENLTVNGLVETDVCIGDTFALGETIVQVSQPRQPCHKLAKRYGVPDMALWVQETGRTGFYFRVIQTGSIQADPGLVLRRLSADPAGISVTCANQLMHYNKEDRDGIRRLLDVEALSASWRATFERRLEGNKEDTGARLNGSVKRG
ncbi:MOSC domain-containing protein YiiM [Aneurinibacillus soli]|uniref:6-N-hydroxylaminopurine resistance protein n=1 Tax=Aneurinibacillus soli TaxID=1500254 RepID=A0A0U5B4F6_9BACL|nr:MOSC domain-containing protein [Aneurinibacillus soli]PYE57252.1 MOSC domain-containing protein YiiM [Aneurinibacillus soli]BAU29248.1 6-N-hydroxylaminopurine resistance protein [Aneurinibacillus soli]